MATPAHALDVSEVCKYCGAIKPLTKSGTPRKRCACKGHLKNEPKVKRDGPTYEAALQKAHHYHFNKAVINSAKAARIRAYTRPGIRGGLHVSYAHPRIVWRGDNHKAVAVLMARAEMAYVRNRDEWAGLLRNRVALRLAGQTNESAAEWLGLSRRELEELDSIIVGDGYLHRLPRSKHDGPIPPLVRKMKSGVASDILRRKRLGLYKQGQVLTPQQPSPLSR